MPKEMATTLKSAVEMGEYASTSEVVREALRDWSFKRQLMLDQLILLKQDIDKGLADVSAGRTREFDAQRIAERGRKLLAARPIQAGMALSGLRLHVHADCNRDLDQLPDECQTRNTEGGAGRAMVAEVFEVRRRHRIEVFYGVDDQDSIVDDLIFASAEMRQDPVKVGEYSAYLGVEVTYADKIAFHIMRTLSRDVQCIAAA